MVSSSTTITKGARRCFPDGTGVFRLAMLKCLFLVVDTVRVTEACRDCFQRDDFGARCSARRLFPGAGGTGRFARFRPGPIPCEAMGQCARAAVRLTTTQTCVATRGGMLAAAG